jgi:hypothetical protein
VLKLRADKSVRPPKPLHVNTLKQISFTAFRMNPAKSNLTDHYAESFRGEGLASGVYLAKLEAGGEKVSMKVTLVK